MTSKESLKKIGARLREDGREIVDARLPARIAELLRKLEQAQQQHAALPKAQTR